MTQADWMDAIDSVEYLSVPDPAAFGPAVALLLLGLLMVWIWNNDF